MMSIFIIAGLNYGLEKFLMRKISTNFGRLQRDSVGGNIRWPSFVGGMQGWVEYHQYPSSYKETHIYPELLN